MNNKNFSELYVNRFSQKEKINKNIMWKTLCSSYIQNYISKTDTVMDIGAGYCEFINNIKCDQRIAVDLNPDTRKMANRNVYVINKSVFNIPTKYNNKINVIFLSNFLEHLNSKDEVLNVLAIVYGLLKSNGKIILLQPNIDMVKEAYWDFIDHKVALNTKSIIEALLISGFKIYTFVKKFLPYTTKNSLLPGSPKLLKIYLNIPQIIRPFTGQSFVVAIKN